MHFKAHLRSYHVNRNSRTIGSYYIDQIIKNFEVGELTNGDYVEINLRRIPVNEFYLKHRAFLSIRHTIEIVFAGVLAFFIFMMAGKLTFFVLGMMKNLN